MVGIKKAKICACIVQFQTFLASLIILVMILLLQFHFRFVCNIETINNPTSNNRIFPSILFN